MKIYLQPKGITLVGKAWQIKYMLKNYMQKHELVQDWIDASAPKK
ncbi:Z-ring formation inhibitor MciZ [Fictibacillus nanhaiensis]|nr:Z-ring formation inhibitor MciZ [Fictibacillus nanhaiensis]MBY6035613.1 Z-ring formation inhibitor MciZ [Fictibacillus nanhaiensis]